MNANTIFLVIQLLIFFLFISCLLVGDTYLTYMIFNSNSYTCESFVDTTASATIPSTTISSTPSTTISSNPSTTISNTPSTTISSTPSTIPSTTTLPTNATSPYSVCYNLSATQLGFARFKIVMFWILFLCMFGVSAYMLAKLYTQNQMLFGIIIAITLIMSIIIMVGGIFMTQYGFYGNNKKCLIPVSNPTAPQTKSTEYCYNLNGTELNFAKIAVVFGWIYSIAAIITIGLFIWEANLG